MFSLPEYQLPLKVIGENFSSKTSSNVNGVFSVVVVLRDVSFPIKGELVVIPPAFPLCMRLPFITASVLVNISKAINITVESCPNI